MQWRRFSGKSGCLVALSCLSYGLCAVLAAYPQDLSAAPTAPSPSTLTPRQVRQQAEAAYGRFDSYIARFVRREARSQGEEILAFYFRKEPWSVRFRWLAGDGKGREVLYVQGRYENKIHALLAPGDVLLVPPGRLMSLPLDSPLVKQASPTPITHSGIGALLERFARAEEAAARGDSGSGSVTVLGIQHRPDYDVPLLMVEQKVPPNTNRDVPRGGRQLYGFHPDLHLPVLSSLRDKQDLEIESFRFDRLQLDVHLNDTDFDPQLMAQRYQPASR